MLPHSVSQKRQKTVCLKHPMPLTVARKTKVSRRFAKQHFRLDICKIRNPFKCQSHGSGHPRRRHRGAALHHIFLPASSRRAGNETFSRRDKIRFADAVPCRAASGDSSSWLQQIARSHGDHFSAAPRRRNTARAGPRFPAAVTTVIPSSQARSTACTSRSSTDFSCSVVPTEIFKMRILSLIRSLHTQSIAARISCFLPFPLRSRIFATTNLHSGAVPGTSRRMLFRFRRGFRRHASHAHYHRKASPARTPDPGTPQSGYQNQYAEKIPVSSTATVIPCPVRIFCSFIHKPLCILILWYAKKAAFRKEQPFCFSFLYLKLNLLFPFPFPESCCKRDAAELSQDKGAPYQIQISKSI